MNVLLLGATGYIGSAVADHLADAGHRVVGLVRPTEASSTPGGRLSETRVGDLHDPVSLTAAVTPDVDAVVHLATPTGDAGADLAVIDALTAPLAGTGRALVYTSGVWVLGETGPDPVAEDAPTNPLPLVGYRPEVERRVLDAAAAGVRSVVLRPGIVHGRGGGIPSLLVDLARERGHGVAVGHPAVTWPMVQVDDLAELFVLAVAGAAAGSLLHGVAEEAVAMADLAAAAARAAGVAERVEALGLDEAGHRFGEDFAQALALSQACSGARARADLGWVPRRAGAVADLRDGSYAASAAA